MHLTPADLQIDTLEDLSILNGNMQVLDDKFFRALAGHETLKAGNGTGGDGVGWGQPAGQSGIHFLVIKHKLTVTNR